MNTGWIEGLKVDEKIIVTDRHSEHVAIIARITKTQIITVNGSKYSKRTLGVVGSDCWSSVHISEATEDSLSALRNRAILRKTLYRVKTYNFENLSIETLKKINDMLPFV